MRTAPDGQPPDMSLVPMSASLRRLASRGTPSLYRKGRLLIREGQQGDALFIIVSGRLRAYAVNDDGSQRVTFGEHLPGEFLGEMSLDGARRSATVEAVVASWCVLVTRATLQSHIAEEPAFAFELLSKVIRRARAATLSLRTIAFNDVQGRVVWLLNTRATASADGRRVVGPVSQQDMADALACNRSMVNRVLHALEAAGHIKLEGKVVHILTALPQRF